MIGKRTHERGRDKVDCIFGVVEDRRSDLLCVQHYCVGSERFDFELGVGSPRKIGPKVRKYGSRIDDRRGGCYKSFTLYHSGDKRERKRSSLVKRPS